MPELPQLAEALGAPTSTAPPAWDAALGNTETPLRCNEKNNKEEGRKEGGKDIQKAFPFSLNVLIF